MSYEAESAAEVKVAVEALQRELDRLDQEVGSMVDQALVEQDAEE